MNYILQESFEGALDIIDNKRSIKVKSIPSNRSFYLFDIKLIPQSLPAPPPPSSSLPPPPSSSSSSSSSSSPSSSPSSNANVNSNSSSTSSSNSSSSLPPFDPANPLIPSICPIKFEVLSAQSTNQSGGNGGPSSSSSSSSSSSMNGLIFAFDHYCSCFSFKHFPSSLVRLFFFLFLFIYSIYLSFYFNISKNFKIILFNLFRNKNNK